MAAKKPTPSKNSKPSKSSSKEREILVVASKVKDFIKSKGCMTAGETIPALSEKIYEFIEAAIARTQGNGRSTVKPQDL